MWAKASKVAVFFSISVTGLFGALGLELAHASVPTQIRVRVGESLNQFSIRGTDLEFSGGRGLHRVARVSEWHLNCRAGSIVAQQIGVSSQKQVWKGKVEVNSPSGFFTFSGQLYREHLTLWPRAGGCDVVNELALEKYLDGLVNAEFNSNWSEAAIDAQVIAARTYALHQIQATQLGRPERHYDVESTIKDQVYGGPRKEDYRSARSVQRTRGWILSDASVRSPAQEAAPIKAFYHSTCGGITELPEHVWGKPFAGFRRSVRCPYCQASPAFGWKTTVSATEFTQIARSKIKESWPVTWPHTWRKWIELGQLIDLQLGPSSSEGRISQIGTVWTREGKHFMISLTAIQLRNWLGTARMKSTAFRVASVTDQQSLGRKWALTGRGNGHGVGMCQWGAKNMGERGFTTAAILKQYYPDASLKKLW